MGSTVCLSASSTMPYISETVIPSLRGNLVILSGFFLSGGICFVWVIGYSLDWKSVAFISTSAPILMTILISFFPETPYWLIENNNYEGARKSLQFFRGKNYDITQEFNEISKRHESKLQNTEKISWKFKVQRIFSCVFWKPWSCVGVLWVLNTFNGLDVFSNYMVLILEASKIEKVWIDKLLAPAIVGTFGVVTAGAMPFCIRRFQPKLLFTTTQFIAAICMLVFATFSYLQEYHEEFLPVLDKYSWIPLVTIIISIWARNAGIMPVVQSLLAESYPTEIRTQAIGITQSLFLASGSLCLKMFPVMKNSMGLSNCFFLYGAVGILNFLWGLITIPDNRGKSLVKVEETYEKNKTIPKSLEIQLAVIKAEENFDKKRAFQNPIDVSDGL